MPKLTASGGDEAGLIFRIVYRKFTHRPLTNQIGQGRLARWKAYPVLLVTTEHESGLWVLYCGLQSETQWSRKLFLRTKPWFLSLLDGTDWD